MPVDLNNITSKNLKQIFHSQLKPSFINSNLTGNANRILGYFNTHFYSIKHLAQKNVGKFGSGFNYLIPMKDIKYKVYHLNMLAELALGVDIYNNGHSARPYYPAFVDAHSAINFPLSKELANSRFFEIDSLSNFIPSVIPNVEMEMQVLPNHLMIAEGKSRQDLQTDLSLILRITLRVTGNPANDPMHTYTQRTANNLNDASQSNALLNKSIIQNYLKNPGDTLTVDILSNAEEDPHYPVEVNKHENQNAPLYKMASRFAYPDFNPALGGQDVKISKYIKNIYENTHVDNILTKSAYDIKEHLSEMTRQVLEMILAVDPNNCADPFMTRTHVNAILNDWSNFVKKESGNNLLFNNINDSVKQIADRFKWRKSDYYNLINQHLQLMLTDELGRVSQAKDQKQLVDFKPISNQLPIDPAYSPEQQEIIKTTEPLTVVAAGAGTGKSTTITGRLQYLKDNKIDMNKVLVLSFTRVAAMNMTEKFPEVQSLTLAKMFDTIYSLNFPNQSLTEPMTLRNAVMLLNPKSQIFNNFSNVEDNLSQLAKILNDIEPQGFKKVDMNKTTGEMTNFVANHLDFIIKVLDVLKQSTLALQPIILQNLISYHAKALKMPNEFQDLKFIMTDESQDISTFEYIILLSLINFYHAQLMMVGDGSQTLYEFRNSNPRFLEMIEGSPAFKNYSLTINYRSKASILQYANQLLKVIDANELSKIQLHPNNFSPLDLNNFNKAVQIQEIALGGTIQKTSSGSKRLKKETVRDNAIEEGICTPKVLEWIKDKFDQNQQIAVLSYRNSDANKALEVVKDKFGLDENEVIRLNKSRQRASTLISTALQRIDKNDFLTLPQTTTAQYSQALLNLIENFYTNRPHPINLPPFVYQAINGLKRNTQIIAAIRMHVPAKTYGIMTGIMLTNETRYNDVRRLLDDQSKQDVDFSTAKLIGATQHGSKGLEFDNTLIIFDETNRSHGDQASLRLFYVASTRAKYNEMFVNLTNNPTYRKVGSQLTDIAQTTVPSTRLIAERMIQPSKKQNP